MYPAGGWRRIRPLGHGATAEVWLATSLTSYTPFAAKSAVRSALGALQREKQILSSLCSPYVVSYVGHDIIAVGEYHLFMEYATGGSLLDEITAHDGCLDETLIKSRTRDILRGLSYLHNVGIAHCDVKSDNVLIAADGHAMLGDLGYARYLDQRFDGRIRGTVMFMAPEVLRREMQGSEADIWALGCTVMEMATGGLPWSYTNYDLDSILYHLAVGGGGLPELPKWLSEEAKDFMGRCLERDPKERWSADELLNHPFIFISDDDVNKFSCLTINNNLIPPERVSCNNINKKKSSGIDDNCKSYPKGVMDQEISDYVTPALEEIKRIMDEFSFWIDNADFEPRKSHRGRRKEKAKKSGKEKKKEIQRNMLQNSTAQAPASVSNRRTSSDPGLW